MRSTKISLIILVGAMILIVAIFRPIRLLQIERVKAQELEPKVEQLKKENDNLKKERDELKRQVQVPIRERVAEEIKHIFGPRAKEALAISECESGINPEHIHYNSNNTVDYSVFQINSIHTKRFGEAFMTNWHENIEVAYQLFKEQGFGPWQASKLCWKDKLASG